MKPETIYYYLFLLMAFLMPVFEKAVPVIIILILVNWLADLQVGLSFLVFPVIFSTTDRRLFKGSQIRDILIAFVAGCVSYSIFMLVAAFYRYSNSLQINEFLYIKLAIGRHPAYFHRLSPGFTTLLTPCTIST
jgi:hypothetical protein